MNPQQINWFNNELYNRNEKVFFRRFEKIFDSLSFRDKEILDFGCGCGALTIDLVKNKQAKQVVGLDLHTDWIEFAKKNLDTNYPGLKNKTSFYNCRIQELPPQMLFDIIVSKEVFEHVEDLSETLVHLQKRLRAGGHIITGFGPLYNSPMGHHTRFTYKFPFAHKFFSEKYLFRKLNESRTNKATDLHDLGLNGLSFKQYKNIIYNCEGMDVLVFKTNISERTINEIFTILSKVKILKEYFTHNIYCVLVKNT